MASGGRCVARVHVASPRLHDLAQHVRRQLPFPIPVDDLLLPGGVEDLHSESMTKRLKEVEVLFCDSPELLEWLKADALPNLKWVQQTMAGVDIIMKGLQHQKPQGDFLLTRGGAYGDVMGEYVIGQIIAWERNFRGMWADQERKKYDKSRLFRVFRPLTTLSIGILGYGSVGTRVADICKRMGMTVWAVTRVQKTSSSPHVDHFRGVESLEEVLQSVDYLCSILPDTPGTTDLLSAQVLKKCQKKKTILISIGRGNVLSEESIVQAIREGWLGGAILDVFNQEPLPPDSELWTLPNVVITPHMSGSPVIDRVAGFFVENLKLFLAGQPLQNVVDWDRGY